MTRPTDATTDRWQTFAALMASIAPDQLTDAHRAEFRELIRGTTLPDDLLMAHVRVIKRQATERKRAQAA